MAENPLVVVATYPDAIQANIAKGLLESEGIDVVLRDEHLVTANWMLSNALGGVRLMVPISSADDANRLLQQASRGELALDDEESALLCPECGSGRITAGSRSWRVAFAALMLLNLPLPYTRASMSCLACGHRWKTSSDKDEEPAQ